MSLTTGPWRERPDLDRKAVRYFVYHLLDSEGSPLYIGRSCNVAARIQSHYRSATAEVGPEFELAKREWFGFVRAVTMHGPYTWDQAVKHERADIERHQPRGNRALTARDYRTGVAIRSSRNAGAAS